MSEFTAGRFCLRRKEENEMRWPVFSRGRFYLAAACVLLLFLTPVMPAFGIVIDNFEDELGPFGIVDNTEGDGSVIDTQTGLSTHNVLSGERRVEVVLGGGDFVQASLSLSSGDDGATCIFGGGAYGAVYYRWTYDGEDLTAGGTQDRFKVTLGAGTEAGGALEVYANSNGASDSQLSSIDGPADIDFLYEDFTGVLLNHVTTLELRVLHGTNPADDYDVIVMDISTAPEPATIALLGLGSLLLRRRCR
jgi:hypothetical protein